MQWTEVSVITSSEAVEAVANILMEHGASGVSIEDAADFAKLKPGKYGPHGEIVDPADLSHISKGAIISAYYPDNQSITDQVVQITTQVQGLVHFGLHPAPAEVTVNDVADENWKTAWEKYYHPVHVTRYLTVVPSWEDYSPKSVEEKIIRLDPGMAFGTGTHPTTQLSLQALEIIMKGHESVLDVGTGSGVLSIAAKLLGATEVKALDVDNVAVASAKKNMGLNPVAKDITVVANNLLTGIHEQVDIVVANILAEIIIPLVAQAFKNLKPGGYFLTSGIIKDKFETIKVSLQENGFVITEILNMKDWYAIIAQKPKGED
ncbi:MAG: 50S ribosomal protein L11 methyltransferase [Lentilactobacillus diolivorans]|jgi:ribosomal protein L11 methyltransferase|uniref:Ribosomal protein L11 methyltransferase n=2 Tax=Lentilactobacillus diolivorans TaxID=179838 RepID=A0A0R1S4R4_9LACO|nr:50S ribosomal protein L11 methyltransferase [Lentilactobacillus diolivorans]KRL64278.1 ribosomal protein L11 methyltransferase [Lentilactobacillus diolivorans DSM 14421]MCH4163202.1 50S ribosomal protein L11 methyltransferase [Lentilactobacillus diolivorans]RRG04589.1 MAG: 50S ribosomal protein L11 methyltransferase [Lactobacillus sp.]GEP22654.1 ribosomal protein L11 methyltransferase [Lentilactobacillus diolivorans]